METKTTEGRIKAIKKPAVLKTGTGKKGKWTLYSMGIMLAEKEWHNATSFNQKELDDMISGLAEGDFVNIVDEQNQKGYWQISSIVKGEPLVSEEELHQEPTEHEIKAMQDDPIERFGKVYARCKAKIEEIYGIKITFTMALVEMPEGKRTPLTSQSELIAAVNTMFIQAAREMKW